MRRFNATKLAVLELLSHYPEGLNFDSIAEMLKTGKGIKEIRSRNTISKALKQLLKNGEVIRDIDTRKYCITEKGRGTLKLQWFADEILSCQSFDTIYTADWAYWKPKLPYIKLEDTLISSSAWFIRRQAESSKYAVMIPITALKSFPTHEINEWIPIIIKCIEDYGSQLKKSDEKSDESQLLSSESSIKEVFKTLFQGIEKIIIVKTLNPSLLYEKLEMYGIEKLKLKEIPEFVQRMKMEEAWERHSKIGKTESEKLQEEGEQHES
ncbi:MAG: hypothetical protein QXG39_02745 [Candidatus Aenigmatarchaeota archaeon]